MTDKSASKSSPQAELQKQKPSLKLGWKAVLGLVVVAVLAGGAYKFSKSNFGHMLLAGHMGHHGAGADDHDEINMPGLYGENATNQETEELAAMFRNFSKLKRQVTFLPNGIRTETFTKDDALRAVLVSHVTGMINRVKEGDDPKIIIQSPTLDILFERRDRIKTEMIATDAGITVTQTSDDGEVVEALHIHAGEVSAMVERGMQAVHEMMMKRQQTGG